MSKITQNTIYFTTNNQALIHQFAVNIKARTQDEYKQELPAIREIVSVEINKLFDKHPDLNILKIVQGDTVTMQTPDFYTHFPNFNSYASI
jgi:hypothetical protein